MKPTCLANMTATHSGTMACHSKGTHTHHESITNMPDKDSHVFPAAIDLSLETGQHLKQANTVHAMPSETLA